MPRLLTIAQANTPLHIVIGSRSDHGTVKRMVSYLKSQDFSDFVIHVLSCHRNPDEVRLFAEEFAGKAIWATGGMSFQLPAVLQSWLFFYEKHVPIWGIQVGQTARSVQASFSAMSVLPESFLIHCKADDSAGSITEAGGEIISLLRGGTYPEEDSPEKWAERLQKFQERQPEFCIKL